MQMSVRVAVVGASGYTGAELMRLIAGASGLRRSSWPPATRWRASAAADVYPSLEIAYPDLTFEAFDPASARRDRPRLPRTAARGIDGAGAPTRRLGRLRRRPVGRVPAPATRRSTRRTTGSSTTQPALLAEAVFGLPELHRDELKAPTRRHAGMPRHRGDAGPAAAGRRRPDRADRHRRRHADGHLRRRTHARTTPTSSPTSTRTSSPTGCSTIGTPRRWSRRSVPTVHLHAPPRADEPRASSPRATPDRRGACTADVARSNRCGRSTPTEPFVAVTAAPPATKSVLGSNAAHVSARFDERTGHGHRDVRDRQPDQGRVGRRRAGGQRRPRASTRPPGSPPSGSHRDRRPGAGRRGPDVPGSRRRRSSRRCRTSGASPARPSSSSTAATRSPARPTTTRWRCSPRTSC